MNDGRIPRDRMGLSELDQLPTEHVAIGLVFQCDRILVSLRKRESFLGGLWEFPGGKRQSGESYAHCVVREVKEETGLDVKVVSELFPVRYDYIGRRVVLRPYECAVVLGEASAIQSDEVRWVCVSELSGLCMPEANREIIRRLESGEYRSQSD
ncbi:MAG: (deoxy)nucleoside triphosphate pyrophosphohydrolase [Armatimonadota bacterium]